YLFLNSFLQGRAGPKDTGWLHADAVHYYTGWPRQTFVSTLSGDAGVHLDAADRLLLGGDTGLRGFDARRFDGTRRVLLNVEDRVHTNRLFLRLLQLGGAVFLDVGNAWGGVRTERICTRDTAGKKTCQFVTEDNEFGNLKADVGI